MAATRPRTLMWVRARRRAPYIALASLLVLLVAPGAAQRRPLNATLAILRGDSPLASGVENYLQVPQVFAVRLDSGLPDWVRRQRRVPDSTPFPCDTRGGRSAQRPSSVHRLRPGDIDVVAAMGDSLVAGNGALDEFALGAIIEYRGVSWCAGGDGTWREAVTLPNLLKEYNPAVRGYSVGRGEFLAPSAGLNVAFPVSADADALQQARTLVRRMRAYPGVDYQRDWKVVTVFFGANDLCSAQCYNPARAAAPHHIRRLRDALDYLHQHMPRAFVNLIPALGGEREVRHARRLHGGDAALLQGVQHARGSGAAAEGGHRHLLPDARLLPLQPEGTRARCQHAVEQHAGARGQQVGARPAARLRGLPLPHRGRALHLHRQQLQDLPAYGPTVVASVSADRKCPSEPVVELRMHF
ncbi:phospholipase B1, membrane-associated-like isoform X2 [Schistocerca gregaria]|uniref:phospholipase B1, membrane-associated-like isoform X2 n=1 Tax=Schistocerca gregaria TaxID=7010 RepID=UPI00211E6B0C|nr:phospholipase B1, membrane-associated-like isoform X2 [Schistocerca gregaria]